MRKAKIYYARMDEFWRQEQKLSSLEKFESIQDVDWQEIEPDSKYTWLTEDLESDFSSFIPIGSKEEKKEKGQDAKAIFQLFSLGIASNRDEWVFSFDEHDLQNKVKRLIENYNIEVSRYSQQTSQVDIDRFINVDPTFVKWTDRLKAALQQREIISFDISKVRNSIYRPFIKKALYFDHLLNQRRYQQHLIFPTPETENENQAFCLAGVGNRQAFGAFATRCTISMDFAFEKAQLFPFYIYDKDGNNRKENITDYALEQFQTHYQDPKITKWDIFHYTYALLHHPHYRQRYAANLKRELPRIPFAPEFQGFAIAGKRLTEIHINYEQQPEYRLKHIENKDLPIDWRVEKMRLSKDKTQIKYNDFLTLTGIPPETFEYKLGNRSALDWIIDQYQVSTDKRSGIANDPNRLDDEEYIVRLIKQVITVSLETVKIVKSLPDLGLPKD
ncbi:MAG: helicase [Pseudanabaena frigida]|uniref:Helicase n=1 Tax=Pseudanabaena frigida TaxID=945775 RepID=A0A2W4Y953_9CYAN|nr:MAG: helicase [Pseudanabaena frigida]